MRPRLTPAIADVRRAVRESLASLVPDASAAGAEPGSPEGAKSSTRGFVLDAQEIARALKTKGRADGLAGGSSTDVPSAVVPVPTVLVALSGGADSLALAAATAFEAPRAGGGADSRAGGGTGLRAGAVIVDHGLQDGSADVAERAAAQARALGLDPVLVRRVEVGTDGGPEAAARDARYAALAAAASETGAIAVLLGHTLDDQAETVLLGLARGSGGASLSGMAPVMRARLRPPETSAPTRAGASDSAGRISGAGRSIAAGSSSAGASEAAGAGDSAGRISGMAPVTQAQLRPPEASAPTRAGASDLAGRISGAGRSIAAGSSSAAASDAAGAGDSAGRSSGAGRSTAAGSSSEAASEAAGGASVTYLRPLLGIRRAQTVQFCADAGLEPWHDPQNADPAFARVRVRETVLPLLERELGPGIAEALARTAELSREDSEALDHFAEEQAAELADHAEAGLSLSVKGLAHNPAALRQRIIRLAVASEFGVSLSRAQTLEVARLVTDWHGQGELHLPGIRVVRQGGLLVFSAAEGAGESRG